LIKAKKRGVRVEVILEAKEREDRTTRRNRRSGKILSESGINVMYDSLSTTTHAKLMIVDGQFILLGSMNWTYYALTDNHEASVLIQSREVAKEVTMYFNKVKGSSKK
jgi:phosphatidylserine/phosphatidylglycerophosphate/cardiolipin synthase-like enzyme